MVICRISAGALLLACGAAGCGGGSGICGVEPCPPVGVQVQNLGKDSTLTRAGETAVAFLVPEDGAVDLNGDGDTKDSVLHVWVRSTGLTRNVGVAVAGSPSFDDGCQDLVVSDGLVAFAVLEKGQGADLNGDGDTKDGVVHVYDVEEDRLVNLGRHGELPCIADGHVAFRVPESSNGSCDLNGDGDCEDDVLHVYDRSTQGVTNTELAIDDVEVRGDGIAFVVREHAQGGQDLNGDGDAADAVLFAYDLLKDAPVPLALAVSQGVVGGYSFHFERGYLVVRVPEAHQGASDLNGDGDASDYVYHVYDPLFQQVHNVALPGPGDNAVSLGSAFEPEPGAAFGPTYLPLILGDGTPGCVGIDCGLGADLPPQEVAMYEVHSGQTTLLGLDGSPVYAQGTAASANFFAFRADEKGGVDLNGDGDHEDRILHVFDFELGVAVNIGVPVLDAAMGPGGLLFTVSEQAAKAVLNGDGDREDSVLHFYDAASGQATNLGIAGRIADAAGPYAAVFVGEGEQGDTHLNGDEDTKDTVVHLVDLRSAEVHSLGLAVLTQSNDHYRVFAGGLLSLRVLEGKHYGVDLNGDGDNEDAVVHVVDVGAD